MTAKNEPVELNDQTFAALVCELLAEHDMLIKGSFPDTSKNSDIMIAVWIRETFQKAQRILMAVEAAQLQRSPKNLHRLASEIQGVVDQLCHPYALTRETWSDAVLKMKSLAEEAALAENKDPEFCVLPAVIASRDWNYWSWNWEGGVTAQARRYLATDQNQDSLFSAENREQETLKWLKLGMQRGSAYCTKYHQFFSEREEHNSRPNGKPAPRP